MIRFTKTYKICFQNLLITMYCWRNYDVNENAIFIVSEVKKADNIPDNNFNKLKSTSASG